MAAESDAEDEVNRTLYCGLPSNEGKITEELLYELFLQAGPLEKVNITKTGTCAFICFKHSVSVIYAIELFKTTTLFGYHLTLKPRTGSRHTNPSGSREQSYSSDSSRDDRYSSGSSYGHRRYEPYPSAGGAPPPPPPPRDAQCRDGNGRASGSGSSSYPPHQHEYSIDGSRGYARYDGQQHGFEQPRGGRYDGSYLRDAHGHHHGWAAREAPRDRHYDESSRGGSSRSGYEGSPSSSQGHFLLENQGRGLLGPLPMDLVNGPFVRNAAQQFISFANPPQDFYGISTDQISIELRRQRMLSTQSQRMAMHRK